MAKIRWNMRVEAEELEKWRIAALGDGKWLSEWIREQCNVKIEIPQKKEKV